MVGSWAVVLWLSVLHLSLGGVKVGGGRQGGPHHAVEVAVVDTDVPQYKPLVWLPKWRVPFADWILFASKMGSRSRSSPWRSGRRAGLGWGGGMPGSAPGWSACCPWCRPLVVEAAWMMSRAEESLLWRMAEVLGTSLP